MPRWTDDDGFTLVETLISIAVIGVVMTSLTAFFTNSLSIDNQQRGKQAAAQILDDAMERVRSLKGSGITAGRDQSSSDTQWTGAPTPVQNYLGDMAEAYDSTAPGGSGSTAALPTAPLPVTVNGLTFYENFYIGECFQPLAGGACVKTAALVTDIELFRVVVHVTWSEKHCPNNGCSLIATSLISGVSVEPLFNSNAVATPPTVTNPGAQVGEVGVAATLGLVASGGSAPIIWSAAGLPANVLMSSSGVLTGAPTVAGAYTVTATATDVFKLIGTATFTLTVNPAPALTTPGPQTTVVGDAVALPLTLTGGTAPFAFTATGLPTGLTVNATTGLVSGTPTTASTGTVTVTVDRQVPEDGDRHVRLDGDPAADRDHRAHVVRGNRRHGDHHARHGGERRDTRLCVDGHRPASRRDDHQRRVDQRYPDHRDPVHHRGNGHRQPRREGDQDVHLQRGGPEPLVCEDHRADRRPQ